MNSTFEGSDKGSALRLWKVELMGERGQEISKGGNSALGLGKAGPLDADGLACRVSAARNGAI